MMRGIGCARAAGMAAGLVLGIATPAGAAPPLSGSIGKLDYNKAAVKVLPLPGPIKIDPAILDVQMSFDFRHASGAGLPPGQYSLPWPPAPTAAKQGVLLAQMSHSFIFTSSNFTVSAAELIFNGTDQLASADFRSDAFDLSQRKAITLDWHGLFDNATFPIQLQLGFGAGGPLATVTFDKGQVLVGPPGQQGVIATYPAGSGASPTAHRVVIRADLVARTYTVRFERGGQAVTSTALPFTAGASAVTVGPQQVTARLFSPKTYVSGYYDVAQASLAGEPM